jgi:hypothetical protein
VIEHFESVPSQHLVVAVDEHHDIFRTAVLCDCCVDVGHCCESFFVPQDGDVVRDAVFLDPLKNELVSIIGGSIINDDYFKVLVVEVDH